MNPTDQKTQLFIATNTIRLNNMYKSHDCA